MEVVFKIKNDNQLIRVLDPGAFCCYRIIQRINDETNKIEETCVKITENVTKIPSHIQYIEVICDNGKLYRDSFVLVAKRPEIESRIAEFETEMTRTGKKESLSVIVLMLDSVSRMHFIRALLKTYAYLQNLSAISLKGYNKVGDGSLSNSVPILSGRTYAELKTECIGNNAGMSNARLDNCPLIWNLFSKNGYRTAFCEDSFFIALFNLRHWYAFEKPPTDHYCRPYAGHMEKVRKYDMCYGRRLSFEVLLEHVKLMAETFKDSLYFSYTMANWISHTRDVTQVSWGDEYLYNLITYLYQNNFLNNTALIILSDHGHRSFEHIEQGKLENRMPAAFMLLPPWFKTECPVAFQNLERNSAEVLTSHFDLHKTLLDFMDLGRLRKAIFKPNKLDSIPNRGISLFERIPNSRGCAKAGIPLQWCVCHKKIPIDVNSSIVREGAKAVLSEINRITKLHFKCAKRSLVEINEALALENGELFSDSCLQVERNTSFQKDKCKINMSLELMFKTSPGNGIFQTVVQYFENGTFLVPEEIIRVDMYNSQSLCVPFNAKVKPYCFCKSNRRHKKHRG